MNYPAIHAPVFRTQAGTPYLRAPGVVMIAGTQVNFAEVKSFLDGFDAELGFASYLDDPTALPPAEALCKLAGQICYMSLGQGRTTNDKAARYFDNIVSSGHGSVLEHAVATFLFYGISRSLTHELVRHRAGFGFSQVSQRYVSGKVLRFVERPEFAGSHRLHASFEERIDKAGPRLRSACR